jgi:hypothetical protein
MEPYETPLYSIPAGLVIELPDAIGAEMIAAGIAQTAPVAIAAAAPGRRRK